MPSHKSSLTLPADPESVAVACRFALNEMQLAVKQDDGTHFVANEKIKMLGFANPAKLDVQILANTNGCDLSVTASNFGFGPVQGEHVKGVTETFCSTVRLKLSDSIKTTSSITSETRLEELQSMKNKGLISEDEFQALRKKALGL